MSTPQDPDRPGGDPGRHPDSPEYPGSGGQPGYGQPGQQYPGQPGQQPPPYGGQPPGYQGEGSYAAYPGAGGPPRQDLPKGMAIAALVLGILALIGSVTVVLSWLGAILGIAAIILGIVGLRKVGRGVAGGRGMAITGVVLGVLGLIVGALITILAFWFFGQFGGMIQECLQYQNDQQRMQQCLQQNRPLNQGLDLDLETQHVFVRDYSSVGK